MNILNISNQIRFDQPSHRYWDKDGNELASVSSVLSLYKPPFDPQGFITRKVAQRDGLTVEQVKNNWNKIKEDACDRGHDFHSQAENFIKTGEILDGTYKDVILAFSKIKFPGPLKSEVMLFSPTHKIAGTADVVSFIDDINIELYDFKTNREIKNKSKYGNKLLHPLEHLDDCEINNYSIQLNLYKLMLEEHGFKVKKIVLFHINPQTREIDTYKIPIIKKDIKKLLNHYSKMRDW